MKERYGVRIPKPCPMKWEELVGDEKKRYCSSCELHVHNLSAMPRGERKEFLAVSRGRSCVAFVVPRPRSWSARLSRVGLLLASLSALWFPGCVTKTSHMTMGVPFPPKTIDQSGENSSANDRKQECMIVVGEEERPLWKRILWPFN